MLEVLRAVASLVAAAAVLQAALGGAPTALFIEFFAGAALAIAGMVLLFTGIELGILPMGRFIGVELPKQGSLWLIVGVAFSLFTQLGARCKRRETYSPDAYTVPCRETLVASLVTSWRPRSASPGPP